MPTFKFKNLTVQLPPDQPEFHVPIYFCSPTFGCAGNSSYGGGGDGCPFTFCLGCTGAITCFPTDLSYSKNCPPGCNPALSPLGNPALLQPGDLSQLIGGLRQTLRDLEVQQSANEARLRPRTVADAELLEEKLNNALGELRELKARLKDPPDER